MNPLADLLGESAGIRAVREKIGRLLERPADARRLPPVLIQGETGTGKGQLARLLHRAGPRADGPFVDVNCAAIPETLLEAEMFGFERGAFTDARRAKPGLFQTAHRGTIFLDEIGLLPPSVQSKLLKAIEERQVRRLGSTRDEPVDAWIIAATNEELPLAIRDRRFREDLYHRLAVLTLELPPLRERGRDVVVLAEHFLARACADYGLPRKTITDDARAALLRYRWPGNVRELVNVLERTALLSPELSVTAATLALREAPPPAPRAADGPRAGADAGEPAGLLDDAVRDRVAQVLAQTGWNLSRSAVLLGVSRNTLRARIEKYGLMKMGGLEGPPKPPALGAPRHSRAAPRDHAQSPPVPASSGVAPMASAAPLPAGAAVRAGALRWESRRVTVLKAVLTAPSQRDAAADLQRALEELIDRAASFGGRVDGVSPRGVVAAFGLEAAEDAPVRAANAALAMQKTVERARRDQREPVGVTLAIHVGQAQVGLAGGVMQLDMDARAALWSALDALVAQAEPDTIAVSERAARFLGRRFEIVVGGSATGTGAAPLVLAGRGATAADAGRRLVEFVGRDHELEFLRRLLASATRGQGQAVGIVGEPGIGKSRLLDEFRQRVAGEPVTYLEGHCQSHGAETPYLPVLGLLRILCDIADLDTPEVVAEKVATALGAAGVDTAAAASCLLSILGINDAEVAAEALAAPEGAARQVFDTLCSLILRRSRRSPLVVAVEDLHWIDGTSEAFLAALAEHLGGAPVLLVATYRPGYRPSWMDKSYATQLALPPLASADGLRIVRSVLGAATAAESVAPALLARAEGNPFFIEELTRAAAERSDETAELGVPETVEDVLLARIGRLPDDARQLLQAASVLGREVAVGLLEAIADGDAAPDASLRELTRLEFLYEEAGGDAEVYVFKHSLTQEVAYQSLEPGRRQRLHAAAGRALETLYADRLDEACERLAQHYARAGDDAKTIEFLLRAAEKSARSSAHAEAVQALAQARERAGRLAGEPDRSRRVLDVALREAHSLHVLGRFDDALALLRLCEAQLPAVDDRARAGQLYFWLGRTCSVLGDRAGTEPAVRRAIELARDCGDVATLGKGFFMLAYEDYWAGRPVDGLAHAREAVSLLEKTAERWWLGMAHWVVVLNCLPIGDFDIGRAAAARAGAIGEAIGDRRLENYAAWATGWIEALGGAGDAAADLCRRALERSQDPVNTAYATGQLGLACLEAGDARAAIPLLEEALREVRAFRGFRQTASRFLVTLGEACLAVGDVETARRHADEGLAMSQSVQFPYGVALAWRALGRIAAAGDDRPLATELLGRALRIFGEMRARFEEARTRVALADVARAAGAEAADEHFREAIRLFAALGLHAQAGAARERAQAAGLDL